MGIIKNQHGVYVARKKVPAHLQEAVANVLGVDKVRQVFLQRSLGTKDLRQAKINAKPALIEFDKILADAAAQQDEFPLRAALTEREVRDIAAYYYADMLTSFDRFVSEAPDIEREYRELEGVEDDAHPIPKFGLSGGQMFEATEVYGRMVPEAEAAWARGDISYVQHQLDELLKVWRIRLNPEGPAYRQLGLAVLQSRVRLLRAVHQRIKGEPVETPEIKGPPQRLAGDGEKLSAAFAGWKKARAPSPGTLAEYDRATRLFIELHGDLPVEAIRRGHARAFREALQDAPRRRTGNLRSASFVEQVAWGRAHPSAERLNPGTINKLLGGVQAVCVWARDNGVIPDDVTWADPFARMRLESDASGRESFSTSELRRLFQAGIFIGGERPLGGQGEAAYWLPLLAAFTGGRQAELASLQVKNVAAYEDTGTPCFEFANDGDSGKRLKTKSSSRLVPVHPTLVQLGWLSFVDDSRRTAGECAWLFPELSPEAGPGPLRAWSKWFNRYLRASGVADANKVFHSFRHGFKDALRADGTPEDISDALTGHSNASVGRMYGAKAMVHRFGMPALLKAVSGVRYTALGPELVEQMRTSRQGVR